MVEILDPRGEKAVVSESGAKISWPTRLVGHRIGFFGNGKSNVEGFFSKWAELSLNAGAIDTLTLMKEGPMAAGGAARGTILKNRVYCTLISVK